MSLSVIVLAAGRGARINSNKPKVLQLLAGRPLLHYVLETCQKLSPAQTIVVCGYQGETLQQNCQNFTVDWVWQEEQRGTGHAVQCAYSTLAAPSQVLVLCGDVPLINVATLQQLLANTPADSLGILTANLPDATGFGRIKRDANKKVVGIVEQRDATHPELEIKEINTGILVLPYKHLAAWLSKLQDQNAQHEYYLTDVVAMAVADNVPIITQTVTDLHAIAGVNSQKQLATLERTYQLLRAEELMNKGVRLYDPNRLDIRGSVTVGTDVTIDVNVILNGEVILYDGVTIGANSIIKDSVINKDTVIHPNSIIDGAVIGDNCQIGPFARIRPGTKLGSNSKIGNFVETKNTVTAEGCKINHLSYIGDAEIGKKVNVGAGVITCNFDGNNKHQTIIEDDAFIGSNCELVAPVKIGKGATLAAGTTLLKDAPAHALTLTKKIMSSIINWQRPIKQKEEL